MYNGIVLSGGSMKGFLQLGFIDELYRKNKLKNVKYYAGTSIGATICILLAIGYTPSELLNYLCVNDVCELFKTINPILLNTYYGLIDSNMIYNYLNSVVMDKIGYIPTFKELYDKFGITFICPAYKINHSKDEDPYVYFTYLTSPNMKITKAAALSSNIPILFTKAEYDNSYYIDGAVFDNFPINKLVQEIKLDPWSDGIYNIIGIKFSSKSHEDTSDNASTLFKYISTIAYAFKPKNKYEHDPNVTVCNIQTNMSILDFNLDTNKKIDLFVEGQNQCKLFFKN